jgi:hypothetical protein
MAIISHWIPAFASMTVSAIFLNGAPERTRTSNPRLSLPTTSFDALILSGLWSGLSLHHHRCRTYSLYGSPKLRFPRDCHQPGICILAVKVSPIQCDPLYGFRFPIKAPIYEHYVVRAKRPVLYPVELQAHMFRLADIILLVSGFRQNDGKF